MVFSFFFLFFFVNIIDKFWFRLQQHGNPNLHTDTLQFWFLHPHSSQPDSTVGRASEFRYKYTSPGSLSQLGIPRIDSKKKKFLSRLSSATRLSRCRIPRLTSDSFTECHPKTERENHKFSLIFAGHFILTPNQPVVVIGLPERGLNTAPLSAASIRSGLTSPSLGLVKTIVYRVIDGIALSHLPWDWE